MIFIEVEEVDRQLILLALAQLSLSRPGFDSALNKIAIQFDSVREGRAILYDNFRNTGGAE
jgi:hypothetical protein